MSHLWLSPVLISGIAGVKLLHSLIHNITLIGLIFSTASFPSPEGFSHCPCIKREKKSRHSCIRNEEKSLPVLLVKLCKLLPTGSVNPVDPRAVPGPSSDVEVRVAVSLSLLSISVFVICYSKLLDGNALRLALLMNSNLAVIGEINESCLSKEHTLQ